MKNGDLVGSAAYGYDWVNGTLVINEKEAAVIRTIFNMYLSGIGKHEIARYLNENNVPRRFGETAWYHTTILYILQNERYIGNALLQKNYTTEAFPFQRKKNHGERSMYYVENSHEPIISQEQFQLADRYLYRRIRRPRPRINHPLSKLLICPECGHNYRRVTDVEKPYWKCSYKSNGSSKCHSIFLMEEDLYAALIRMVNILRQNYDTIIKPVIKALEQLQCKVNGTQHKLYEIDKSIAETNSQIHLLSQLQTQGILDAADFASQNSELTNKVYRLRSERMALLRQNEHDDNLVRLRKTCEIIAEIDDDITEYDETLIRSIVEKIIVRSATDIEVHLIGSIIITEHLPERRRRINHHG